MTKSRLYELLNGRLRWWLMDVDLLGGALDVSPELIMRAAGYGGGWPPIRDAVANAPDLTDAQKAELLGYLGRLLG